MLRVYSPAEGCGVEAGTAESGPKGPSHGAEPGTLTRLLEDLARAPQCEPGQAWVQGPRPGDVLDRFEILRELGRGGFGAVYEAVDRELGRRVALKTLRPGRSRDEWADGQLRNEAQAAASLSHPGIVTLYEACTCDRGPYLVMELLRGETLETRLRRGPLPVEEAVEVGLQTARALAHVHAHHLVHRDLKPANIHLGQDGRVKLLDLGLAHLLGRKSSTGGTPAYVAPEQWRGEELDGRADVFALGAILFEAVSGRRAFEVKEERSSALDPGPAPALHGKLPPRLVRLVARCLSKDPGGRPTAAQAAEELLEVQRRRGHPMAVRKLAVLTAVMGVAGVAAATMALWRRDDVLPRAEPGGRAVKVEAYASYFEAMNLLAEAWDLSRAQAALRRAVALDPDFALARLHLAILARWYLVSDEDPQEQLAAVRRLGDGLPEKERLLAALVTSERPKEIRARASELADRFPEDKMALFFAGDLAREEGQADVALDRLGRALELDPAFAPALAGFVTLTVGSNRPEEGLAVARRAVEARPGPHTLACLGMAYAARGEKEAALSEVRRAVDLGAGHNPATSIKIARVLFFTGHLREAESVLHAWRDCAKPWCGRALLELGMVYLGRGRLREASHVAERLRRLSGSWKGEGDTLAGAERLVAGDVTGAAREWVHSYFPPAANAYVGNLASAAERARTWPADSFRLDFYRGILSWRAGDRQAGAAHLRRGLAKDGSQAQAFYWIAEMRAEAGDHQEVVRALEQFFETFKFDSGILPHVFRPRAQLLLARSQVALGRTSSARATLDHLLEELAQADPDLPLLAEAKALRKRLAAPEPRPP
jgi:tetratricopeptide (TPR) repeat protein